MIGAIDLGLFGIIPADANGEGFDLIQQVLGFNPDVLNAFYILVGASGLYLLVTHVKDCKVCEARNASSTKTV